MTLLLTSIQDISDLVNIILPLAHGRRKIHTEFWWGNLEKGEHLEDLGVDGRIVLENMPCSADCQLPSNKKTVSAL
jgi:hypothetical protein